jgi:hypothetical protein
MLKWLRFLISLGIVVGIWVTPIHVAFGECADCHSSSGGGGGGGGSGSGLPI